MPIRAIKLPEDFPALHKLLPAAFEYPDNPEWIPQQKEIDDLSNNVTTLQMLWPMMKVFKLFSPRMRSALTGYVWEEEGQALGMVTITRRGRGKEWHIESLGVLPEFRRRGIGTELARAALELMRSRGGTYVVQGVPEGNLPAFEMYQKLGMEKFSETEDFEGKFEQAPSLPKVPDGYRHQVIPMRDWKPSHDLAKKVTPPAVQQYDPITKDRYYISPGLRLMAQLFARLRGTTTEDFALVNRASGEVEAMGFLRAEAKAGRHSLAVICGEEQADLVPFMLDYMLYVALNLSKDTRVDISLPDWRAFARPVLLEKGFTPLQRWQRMGMKL